MDCKQRVQENVGIPHLASLAVQVVQDDVLWARQDRLCVYRWWDVEQGELEVWWHGGRFFRVVLGCGVGIVVAFAVQRVGGGGAG